MQQILYLIQKEFRQISRDRAMMFILLFAPLVQLTILGFAITIDIKHVKFIVADFDRTPISREIIRKFQHNPYFNFKGYVDSPREIRTLIDDWDAQMALVIPVNFTRDLQLHRFPQIQIIVDGLDGNTAGIALGYAQGILQNFMIEWFTTYLPRMISFTSLHTVQAETRMWYNLDLKSKNYMVPGLLVVLLTMISMFLTSMGLVREKEIGTLEQLMVTPIKTYQLILGKVLPFLILGFVELTMMLGVAFLVFHLKMVGNFLWLYGLAALYLLSTLGLGIFISTLAQTQQQAMFISWFFMIFMIFMSGFLFPIANMPPFIQKITYLDPMRYFMIIVREIFLKGTTPRFLIKEIVSLALFGAIIITMSSIRFQKRVK